MLAIISPAKTLDYHSSLPELTVTQPALTEYSQQLIEMCRALSPQDIASLMKISDKLSGLNAARFAEWTLSHNQTNSRPAIYAFKGDVYTGFDVDTLTVDDIDYAQQHLRILSGLYGVLKPLDLMQPYRLEMGTKLANNKGKNLYDFWQSVIALHLQTALEQQGDTILVNLASDEYFKAVDVKQLKAKIIKPIFLDYKNGQYKVISFYAKKARGLMARYLVQQRVQSLSELIQFDLDGYYFVEAESTNAELVFKRD